jgi:hypothetical protein
MSISACQLSRLIEQSGCTFTGAVGEFGHYATVAQISSQQRERSVRQGQYEIRLRLALRPAARLSTRTRSI